VRRTGDVSRRGAGDSVGYPLTEVLARIGDAVVIGKLTGQASSLRTVEIHHTRNGEHAFAVRVKDESKLGGRNA
jgi:hypothetical protein